MITAVDIDFDVIKSPNQPAAVHVPCQEERGEIYRFQDRYYRDYKWLHYEADRGFLCFYCLKSFNKRMISVDNDLFQKTFKESDLLNGCGFTNFKKATEKFSKHSNSKMHLSARDAILQQENQINILNHMENACLEEKKRNRVALLKIFDSIRYLARQGLAIRGHDDMNGNFHQLLTVRQLDVPELKDFMTRKKNYEILQLLSTSITTTKNIPWLSDALSFVNGIGSFIQGSPKRLSGFEMTQQHFENENLSSPRPLCPTRWTVRVKSIDTVLKNYKVLLNFLNDLAQSTKERPDVSAKARGFLRPYQVRGKQQNLLLLEEIRSKEAFSNIWKRLITEIEKLDLDLPELSSRTQLRKYPNSTPYQVAEKVYEEAVTTAIEEIQRRFDQKDFKAYQHLENLLISPDKETEEITSNWGFRLDDLKLELRMLKRSISFQTSAEAIQKFKGLHSETQALFPEVRSLLECLLVIPASSAEAERSFSTLKRVKTYLRATMTTTRLNSLCVLHTYQELLDKLDLQEEINIKLWSFSKALVSFGPLTLASTRALERSSGGWMAEIDEQTRLFLFGEEAPFVWQ
ncbi:uncharacterized protein DMENIID0001_135670 [Sergentomyia squamirostris]